MLKSARPVVAYLSTILIMLTAVPAHARECGDVRMPNRVTVGETQLVLNGMGIREATVFNVDVYVAGLYLENRSRSSSNVINSEQTKRLVMHFVREVERDDIRTAFDEGFRANGGTAAMADNIRQLRSWIPRRIRPGLKATFTYIPGTGMEVKFGRTVKGVLPGAAFAKVFLKIFVGPNPPNAGLKTGLLGGQCG